MVARLPKRKRKENVKKNETTPTKKQMKYPLPPRAAPVRAPVDTTQMQLPETTAVAARCKHEYTSGPLAGTRCDQPVAWVAPGLCITHYNRQARGQAMDAVRIPRGKATALQLRFASEVMDALVATAALWGPEWSAYKVGQHIMQKWFETEGEEVLKTWQERQAGSQ